MLPKDPYSPRKPEKRLVSTSSGKEKPSFIGPREAMIVAMITVLLAVILFGFEGPDHEENAGAPFEFTEMAYPDLKQLPVKLSTERMALFTDRATEYLETPERIFGQPLEIMIEWSRQQMIRDEERAPIPLRLSSIDLSRTSFDSSFFIPSGTPVVISGQIVEKHPFAIIDEEGGVVGHWQRLLIESAPAIFVQVFSRGEAAELPLGAQVNVVGRYWGVRKTPVAVPDEMPVVAEGEDIVQSPEHVGLPTLASFRGSVIEQEDSTNVVSLLGLGQSDQPGTTAFRLDPKAFDEIDDEGLRLERRPYYYALGLVSRDRSDPTAYSGEILVGKNDADRLHFNAASYRGHPVTINGKVLQSWDDYDVEVDKPFGVQRVIRMWLYGYTSYTETVTVNGEEREMGRQKYAFYELAVVVDADRPLPNPGEFVQATGRFLKIQRYRIRDDFMFNRGSLSEENAPLSDSSFFKFVVANDFVSSEQTENAIGITLKVFFLVVFASFLVFMVRLIDKDRQRMDSYKRPVRRLRKSRKALQQKQREALAAQGSSASAEPDEDSEYQSSRRDPEERADFATTSEEAASQIGKEADGEVDDPDKQGASPPS